MDGEDYKDDSEDYQLHPHYTSLEVGKTATGPHNDLCRLSINGSTLEDPKLVIGIGRLFVNVSNAKAERTSKWTGYEVFVDNELALWMVFDRHSNDPLAEDWYPVPCRLSHPTLQDTNDEQRARRFDVACFLTSLRDLANANFKTASEKVQEKSRRGEMRVCEVERSEIDKLLETELVLQEASVDNPARLREAILNAVGDGRRAPQKLTDLLDIYEDSFGIIREVITEEVVEEAAQNEGCGERVMTILLQQLKEEVCKSISTEVFKGAAGDKAYGAQIMEKLLKVCRDVVCEKLSFEVICTAAQNGESEALILYLLLTANKEKVRKLVGEVDSRAAKGGVWLKEILLKLEKRLYEIPNSIGYPITAGMRLEQCLTLLEDAPPWLTVEQCSAQLGS